MQIGWQIYIFFVPFGSSSLLHLALILFVNDAAKLNLPFARWRASPSRVPDIEKAVAYSLGCPRSSIMPKCPRWTKALIQNTSEH